MKCFFLILQEGSAINDLIMKGAKFPYIIAVGQDKSTISKYYIEFEKHLFDVRLFMEFQSIFRAYIIIFLWFFFKDAGNI